MRLTYMILKNAMLFLVASSIMTVSAIASCTRVNDIPTNPVYNLYPSDVEISPVDGQQVFSYQVTMRDLMSMYGLSNIDALLFTCNNGEVATINIFSGATSTTGLTYGSSSSLWTQSAGGSAQTISTSAGNFSLASLFGTADTSYAIQFDIYVAGTTAAGSSNAKQQMNILAGDGQTALTLYINSFTITRPTCVINTYDAEVSLGKVVRSALDSLGATANATDFNISMTCASSVLKPTLTFEGSTHASNYVDTFRGTTGAGYASGVGVRLSYNGTIISPGKAVSLTPGSTAMENYTFSAIYLRHSELSAGAIEVPVTFTLSYE